MRFLVTVTLLLSLASAALAAAPPLPTKEDRCAVCGMFVAPFPQWVSVIVMNDGRRLYFDGPKDMFIAVFDLPAYLPGASLDQVAGVFVTEYYSAALTPAAEVLFVTGSNVMGPMGQELVPVAGREAAETFRRDHAGQAIMRFDGRQLVEVTAQP